MPTSGTPGSTGWSSTTTATPSRLQPAGIAAPTGAPLTAGPYPAGPARRSAAETPPAHCTDDTRRWAAVAESILPLTLPDRRPRREIAPGAVHVPGWLSIEQQRRLVVACRGWAAGPVPIRAARLPGGHVMSVRTVCLGWHWQPYRYTRTAGVVGGAGVPVGLPVPAQAYRPDRHDVATGQPRRPDRYLSLIHIS